MEIPAMMRGFKGDLAMANSAACPAGRCSLPYDNKQPKRYKGLFCFCSCVDPTLIAILLCVSKAAHFTISAVLGR